MKLNFWQWLGIILLIVGGIGYFIFREESKPAAPTTPPPATQPAP